MNHKKKKKKNITNGIDTFLNRKEHGLQQARQVHHKKKKRHTCSLCTMPLPPTKKGLNVRSQIQRILRHKKVRCLLKEGGCVCHSRAS